MTDFGARPASAITLSQQVNTLVDGVVFNSANEDYTSAVIDVSALRNFTLLIDLGVTLAPTDILIQPQFSDDDLTYYNLVNGPFGSLLYEDEAGAKKEAITGVIMAQYLKLYVLSSGCDATNFFTLTAKIISGTT